MGAAVAISIVFAGQLGGLWMATLASQRGHARAVFEHAQALHHATAELEARVSATDLQRDGAFREDIRRLVAQLDVLVAGNSEETAYVSTIKGNMDQWERTRTPGSTAAEIALNAARLDAAGQRRLMDFVYKDRETGWFGWVIAGELFLAFFAAWTATGFYRERRGNVQQAVSEPPARPASRLRDPLNAAYENLKAEVFDAVQSQDIASTEKILREIAERTSLAMYLRNAAGQYLFTNAPFSALFLPRAIPRDRSGDRSREYRFAKATADAIWRSDLKAFEPGVPLAVDEIQLDATGSERFYSLRFPLLHEGNPYAVCGFLLDARAGRGSEDIGSHDVPILRSVLDSMSDGVVVLNADASCLFANRRMESILGSEFAGMSLNQWVTQFGLSYDGSTPCSTEELPLSQALLGAAVQHATMCVNRATWLRDRGCRSMRPRSGTIRRDSRRRGRV